MTADSPQPSLRRRTLAFALDYVLIAAYLVAVGVVFGLLRMVLPGPSDAVFNDPIRGQLTGFVVVTLPVTLYFATSEASRSRGTWGKRRLGLRVTDTGGSRLSLARALARSAAKFTPWELAHTCIWQSMFGGPEPPVIIAAGFAVVYALIGANLLSVLTSPRRQALYDLVTGTLVTAARGDPGRARLGS